MMNKRQDKKEEVPKPVYYGTLGETMDSKKLTQESNKITCHDKSYFTTRCVDACYRAFGEDIYVVKLGIGRIKWSTTPSSPICNVLLEWWFPCLASTNIESERERKKRQRKRSQPSKEKKMRNNKTRGKKRRKEAAGTFGGKWTLAGGFLEDSLWCLATTNMSKVVWTSWIMSRSTWRLILCISTWSGVNAVKQTLVLVYCSGCLKLQSIEAKTSLYGWTPFSQFTEDIGAVLKYSEVFLRFRMALDRKIRDKRLSRHKLYGSPWLKPRVQITSWKVELRKLNGKKFKKSCTPTSLKLLSIQLLHAENELYVGFFPTQSRRKRERRKQIKRELRMQTKRELRKIE